MVKVFVCESFLLLRAKITDFAEIWKKQLFMNTGYFLIGNSMYPIEYNMINGNSRRCCGAGKRYFNVKT